MHPARIRKRPPPWAILLVAPAFLGFSEPRIRMHDPVVVTMGPPEEKRWGFYQFPHLERWADGRIAVTFSVHPDAAESYGLSANVPNVYVSSDEGRTWRPHTGASGSGGLLLPTGDRLRISTPRAVPVSELQLPQPVGRRTSAYGRTPYTLY